MPLPRRPGKLGVSGISVQSSGHLIRFTQLESGKSSSTSSGEGY